MKEKLAKLIDVKTIITFALVGTTIYLACKGTIEAKDIVLFVGIVLTYFFNKKPDEAK